MKTFLLNHLFTDKELPKAYEELLQFDNVLLSPHIAGWTKESKMKLAETTVEKILNISL